jgi:hypothetical protein
MRDSEIVRLLWLAGWSFEVASIACRQWHESGLEWAEFVKERGLVI